MRILQIRHLEILLNSSLLVTWLGEIIREAARRGEVLRRAREINMHDALAIEDRLVGIELGAADGGDIGTVTGVLGVEYCAFWTQTAVGFRVAGEGGYAVVARGCEDRVTLEAEFHELVALTFGIADGEVGFGLAVGCADHVGGLVDSALELTFVD
jgi:hypothetical protein